MVSGWLGRHAWLVRLLLLWLGGVPLTSYFPRLLAEEVSVLQHQLHLQRFQALCRSTAPAPPIRVLIYGQSITAQPWSWRMMEDVQQRYPGRQWVIENRSIGGHLAQFLLHTAEADLYPFHPDLLIFHAYGDTNAYRQLVESVRQRTTADVLLMNDHYAIWDSLGLPGIGEWDGKILPDIALKNGACLADIRTPWRQYLLDHYFPIRTLLSDGIHPNTVGQDLMQSLMMPYVAGAALSPVPDPYQCGRARRILLPAGAVAAGEWRLKFQGQRVTARVGLDSGVAKILVDGQPPSAWLTGSVHGRASAWPGGWWPCLLQIRSQSPPHAENWRLRIAAMKGPHSFDFSLIGERSGPDGNGSTDTVFQSPSGRVVIRPEDWYWDAVTDPLSAGMEFTWSSVETGIDVVTGRPDSVAPEWVDLTANLAPGEHELRIVQSLRAPPIREVIVYDPRGSEVGDPGILHRLDGRQGFWAVGYGDIETATAIEAPVTKVRWTSLPVGASATDPWGRRQVWVPQSDAPASWFRLQPGIQ